MTSDFDAALRRVADGRREEQTRAAAVEEDKQRKKALAAEADPQLTELMRALALKLRDAGIESEAVGVELRVKTNLFGDVTKWTRPIGYYWQLPTSGFEYGEHPPFGHGTPSVSVNNGHLLDEAGRLWVASYNVVPVSGEIERSSHLGTSDWRGWDESPRSSCTKALIPSIYKEERRQRHYSVRLEPQPAGVNGYLDQRNGRNSIVDRGVDDHSGHCGIYCDSEHKLHVRRPGRYDYPELFIPLEEVLAQWFFAKTKGESYSLWSHRHLF